MSREEKHGNQDVDRPGMAGLPHETDPAVSPAGNWHEEPPREQGDWWWLSDQPGATPLRVSILYGSTACKFFAPDGQHGWQTGRYVDDMGGKWMKAEAASG
jgi:hypothetical protein